MTLIIEYKIQDNCPSVSIIIRSFLSMYLKKFVTVWESSNIAHCPNSCNGTGIDPSQRLGVNVNEQIK